MMKNSNDTLSKALSLLPHEISLAAENTLLQNSIGRESVTDIRLRANGSSFISTDSGTYKLDIKLSEKQLSDIVFSLSGNSLYAHSETLRQGFIDAFGFRIGVAGRAVTDGNRVIEMTSPTSITVRIPHTVNGCSYQIAELLKRDKFSRGIIIYSPPGGGKTTLLCDLISSLSRENIQFSVIDSRGELSHGKGELSCDILLHYPKAAGIEIAVRTLSPSLIICDELSGNDDGDAALYAFSSGIPIIATAHAGAISELYKREGMRKILDAGVFGYAIGIKRIPEKREFQFDINEIL